jgi:hypothetical protein
MGIFLDGCTCDLVGTSVMSKMDHLATLALEYPPEDAYCCVMAIEDGCCGYDSDGHFPARGRDWGIGSAAAGAAFHDIPKT